MEGRLWRTVVEARQEKRSRMEASEAEKLNAASADSKNC